MLHGRKYMLTTSWNAPKEVFTLPREFFDQQDMQLYQEHLTQLFLN